MNNYDFNSLIVEKVETEIDNGYLILRIFYKDNNLPTKITVKSSAKFEDVVRILKELKDVCENDIDAVLNINSEDVFLKKIAQSKLKNKNIIFENELDKYSDLISGSKTILEAIQKIYQKELLEEVKNAN